MQGGVTSIIGNAVDQFFLLGTSCTTVVRAVNGALGDKAGKIITSLGLSSELAVIRSVADILIGGAPMAAFAHSVWSLTPFLDTLLKIRSHGAHIDNLQTSEQLEGFGSRTAL